MNHSSNSHETMGMRAGSERRPSKKQLVIEAYQKGERNIWRLADELHTQPSYIASVLQSAGLINGYYDLYTTPSNPLNIYFPEFQGKMGFKNVDVAQRSVQVINDIYWQMIEKHDRAGQHQCLVTALTMYNRARFIGKVTEAHVFKQWLLDHL